MGIFYEDLIKDTFVSQAAVFRGGLEGGMKVEVGPSSSGRASLPTCAEWYSLSYIAFPPQALLSHPRRPPSTAPSRIECQVP
jgi:hypothetical protein